ncbi:MAG TPA: hypothetical protein VJL61_12865 [Rhodanobacteraceae bacterium]|nr:hypothetical protein [Rhodanobacteraceae bacterium]
MPTPATLLWGMLFGAIGVGFFIYGKRQARIMPLVCGIALIVVPWFVSGALLTFVIGLALVVIPFVLRF